MRNVVFAAVVAIAAAAAPAIAGPGGSHGHAHHGDEETAYGKPGDPAKAARTVEIAMREGDGRMSFSVSELKIKRGEQIRFKLRNDGALDHELVIATVEENRKHAEMMLKHPDMEHDDPNAKRLAPGKAGEIVWHFTKPGTFEFACLIPGHLEGGMVGRIVVE